MRRVLGAGALLLASVWRVEAQCAMCRGALVNSPEGQAMAASFNQGILILLAAPFLIVMTVGLRIAIAQYRGRHREVLVR